MKNDIMEMLKYLRFRGLHDDWERYIDIAQKGNFSHTRLLEYVVCEEYKLKKQNARKLRFIKAKIPEKFAIETYPWKQQKKLKRKKILSIYDSFDYMEKHQNIILIGPTGVGKTGLATAFLTHAIDQGYKGRFIQFPELVELLYKSVADHSEDRVLKTFSSYDCLLIDELGYVEIEPIQVGLFFTLMSRRHKAQTTLITSNLGFEKWGTFLKDNSLTAALIDRLTENSYVINMKDCVSLRAKLNHEPLIESDPDN